MFLLRRPTAGELENMASRCEEAMLSYTPAGMAADPPVGFHVDEARALLGRGEPTFLKAKSALEEWREFNLGWVEVFPRQAALEPGTVVLVLVRHLGFWSVNPCRVLYRFGSPQGPQFGFGYGTLPEHAERGEEVFKVVLDGKTGEVTYEMRAVSRPRAPLAWIGYPVTRVLQARFRRDSMAAMKAWVSSGVTGS